MQWPSLTVQAGRASRRNQRNCMPTSLCFSHTLHVPGQIREQIPFEPVGPIGCWLAFLWHLGRPPTPGSCSIPSNKTQACAEIVTLISSVTVRPAQPSQFFSARKIRKSFRSFVCSSGLRKRSIRTFCFKCSSQAVGNGDRRILARRRSWDKIERENAAILEMNLRSNLSYPILSANIDKTTYASNWRFFRINSTCRIQDATPIKLKDETLILSIHP